MIDSLKYKDLINKHELMLGISFTAFLNKQVNSSSNIL